METSVDNKYTNCMPGDCVYNAKEDIAFLLVPKCATSIIRDHEKTNNDWSRITLWEEKKCPSRFIVILRDPIERFISTVNMYLGWREVEPQTNYVTFNFSDGVIDAKEKANNSVNTTTSVVGSSEPATEVTNSFVKKSITPTRKSADTRGAVPKSPSRKTRPNAKSVQEPAAKTSRYSCSK